MRALLLTGLALALAGPVAAAPVAVELFTSQGCSSCPPADAAIARLTRDPGVVAITRPVTYWDRLGWKDTLAREENTRLQRAYAARVKSGNVYTPQAVVQGGTGVVGSREADVRRLVAAAARAPAPSLRIEHAGGRAVAVFIEGPAVRSTTVTIIAMRSTADVAIGRGENGGRHVRYTNVVRSERAIGTWSGGKGRFAIPAAALGTAGADRYAVLVQERDAGPIVAASYL